MAIVAVQYPIFQRAMRVISTISQATHAEVTTTFAHQYKSGEIIRFVIPLGFGMQQIDQMQAPITVTGSTTFTVPIDTTTFDAFSVASTFPNNKQYAQVVPLAEIASQLEGATQNVLPYGAV
jgi:hypothetical protein